MDKVSPYSDELAAKLPRVGAFEIFLDPSMAREDCAV